MFNNYLKTALRHIQKHKQHAFLNVFGLVVAFTCSMLIYLFVDYEFSYDRHHENADNVYRVVQEDLTAEWRGSNMWNATSGLLKPAILENCPEVTNAVMILPIDEVEVFRNNQYYQILQLCPDH